MDKNPKNPHVGHRARLLNLVTDVGLDRVTSIQALEYILTFIFPRGDTNPLAHALLKEFGTTADVLNADWELVKEVPGMGERSAKMLHSFIDIFYYYTDQMLDKKFSFRNRGDIADYFEELLRFKLVEYSYIVGLDASRRVKLRRRVQKGGLTSVGINVHEIAKFVTSVRPAYVFVAHNHPQGAANPSDTDIDGTVMIKDLVESLGTHFVDHVIVGIDGIYSVQNQDFYRTFEFKPNLT